MLSEPGLPLYTRALTNLLVSCVADYRKHTDKAKYAHKCIALLEQLRKEPGLDSDFPIFDKIEDSARQALVKIEGEAKRYNEAKAAVAAKAEKEAKNKMEFDESHEDEQDQKTPASPAPAASGVRMPPNISDRIDPGTLEGAHTDLKIGRQSQQDRNPVPTTGSGPTVKIGPLAAPQAVGNNVFEKPSPPPTSPSAAAQLAATAAVSKPGYLHKRA